MTLPSSAEEADEIRTVNPGAVARDAASQLGKQSTNKPEYDSSEQQLPLSSFYQPRQQQPSSQAFGRHQSKHPSRAEYSRHYGEHFYINLNLLFCRDFKKSVSMRLSSWLCAAVKQIRGVCQPLVARQLLKL